MKSKPILIVAGDHKSIFYEIFFKALKFKKFKSPIIVIGSLKILKYFQKKINFKKKIRLLNLKDIKSYRLDNKEINLIDIKFLNPVNSKGLNFQTKSYLKECFEVAIKLLKSGLTNKFINGPINKNEFLNKKFLGMTEYISKKFNKKKTAMLIYNKNLSVCPVTTHLPIKLVSKKINKKIIKEKAVLIDNFYKKNIGVRPKIAVTGLNPHCESILKFNEDEKIIKPSINILKKRGLKISGPYAADTVFLKQNREKFDVVLGMYHDQVLAPLKTLKEYDAINITLGLPFFRISPDHGPNNLMIGKNYSNPLSLIQAINFLDKR